LHGNIVDAVVHQVLADGLVAAGEKCNLQLGAHAIRGTYQYRFAKSGKLKSGAERANIGQHIARERLAGEFLDGGHRAVSFVDIDAGVAIT